MKKAILLIIIFLFTIQFVLADGCCTNSGNYKCKETSSELCCDNETECEEKNFFSKTNCLEISDCEKGCCCKITKNYDNTIDSKNLKLSYEFECNENETFIKTDKPCSKELCSKKNSEKETIPTSKSDDNLLQPKKFTCLDGQCILGTNCYLEDSVQVINSKTHLCKNEKWHPINLYNECSLYGGECISKGFLNWRTWFWDFKCKEGQTYFEKGQCAPREGCCVVEDSRIFDWRNNKGVSYVTPIKNQGECGSCWAHATAAFVESQLKIHEDSRGEYDLSEQYIMACSGAAVNREMDRYVHNWGCEGGSVEKALIHIMRNSIIDEKCFPYQERNTYCSYCSNPKKYKLFGLLNQNRISISNPEKFKKQIKETGPVIFSYYTEGSYKNNIYVCEGHSKNKTHSILLIGYDDRINAFIAKNSWGRSYRDNGFFYLDYDQNCGTEIFNNLEDLPLMDPSANYCIQVNGEYINEGDKGTCKFSDGTEVDSWRFLEGKVAKDKSYCVQNGYELIVKTDGKNRYTPEYAVCVIPADHQGGIGPQSVIPVNNEISVVDALDI
jgi:C1A family cysteine protease